MHYRIQSLKTHPERLLATDTEERAVRTNESVVHGNARREFHLCSTMGGLIGSREINMVGGLILSEFWSLKAVE